MKISTLGHTVFHRIGGSGVRESFSCDFTVNGHSLLKMLEKLSRDQQKSDLIGCFIAGMPKDLQKQKHLQLLCQAPPDTTSGRIMLYVCPECADLGCGAYTLRIDKENGHYKWFDFAYENGYENPVEIPHTGVFLFEAITYEKAIEDAMI